MPTFLVAGAAGLLGSTVARWLLDAGETVVLADHFDDGGDGRLVKEERARALLASPNARLARGDLTDAAHASRVFSEFDPGTVVNAAAFAPGSHGVETLVELARAHHAVRFLHLSDAALYPSGDGTGERRAREDEALDPAGSEGRAARVEEERLVRASGLPFVVLRVFEVVGPRFPIGRFPMEILEAIALGEIVHLPEETRDLLHVDDAGRGLYLAARLEGAIGRTLNLGSGVATSTRDLAEALARHAGRPLRKAGASARGRARRIADMQGVWEAIGFSPTKGLDDLAADLVAARFFPAAAAAENAPVARHGSRLTLRSSQAPSRDREDDRPREVSRRDLFGLFRKPFDRLKP